MTQTDKQIKHLNALKYRVPKTRASRELRATYSRAILVNDINNALNENLEADIWASGRYV